MRTRHVTTTAWASTWEPADGAAGTGKKQAVVPRRYAGSASRTMHNLVKQTQIVLFHRANGELQVSPRCFHGVRTISFASIRVPTMRMRTLRPLTMLCGVSTGCARAPTHVRRRRELGRVRVRLELVVDWQQMGRNEHAERPHLAEEAHFVHVGDPRVHHLALELRRGQRARQASPHTGFSTIAWYLLWNSARPVPGITLPCPTSVTDTTLTM